VGAHGHFRRQRRKETLGDRMVPTIPPPTHRPLDLPGGQPLLICRGGILTALIGMLQQREGAPALLERPISRPQGSRHRHLAGEGPADHPS